MGMSTNVRLPKDVKPIFPLRCVYSDAMHPDSEAGIVAHSQNSLLHFLSPFLILFGWRKVRAPIFSRNHAKFYLQAYGRNLITLAVVIVALVYIIPMFEPGSPWRKLKILGLCLVALLPWILFQVLYPPRFDVTVYDDVVDYEFASAIYAAEFAEINSAHVIRVTRPPE